MHPILLHFKIFGKDIFIGTYGLLIITAIATATITAMLFSRKFRYKMDDVFNYTTIIATGGIIGAFAVGFIIFLPQRISYGFFQYPPSLVSWGGIIGGLVTIFILKRNWHINLLNLADITTPGVFLGIGIGRIGCHFGGCCYGLPTNHALGILFTHPKAPASSIGHALIPTQLISAGVLITIGLLLIPLLLRRKTSGYIFVALLILYPLFRFTIEFFRADPRAFLFGLSDGQLFSIVSFLIGIGTYFFIRYKLPAGSIYMLHKEDISAIDENSQLPPI